MLNLVLLLLELLFEHLQFLICDFCLAEGTHIIHLNPIFDAVRVEVVTDVAGQRNYLVVIFELAQADSALVVWVLLQPHLLECCLEQVVSNIVSPLLLLGLHSLVFENGLANAGGAAHHDGDKHGKHQGREESVAHNAQVVDEVDLEGLPALLREGVEEDHDAVDPEPSV